MNKERNLAYFRFSEWWHRCLVYLVILVFVAVTTHFQANFFSISRVLLPIHIYKFLFLLHMAPIFQRIFRDTKYTIIPKCFKIWGATIKHVALNYVVSETSNSLILLVLASTSSNCTLYSPTNYKFKFQIGIA